MICPRRESDFTSLNTVKNQTDSGPSNIFALENSSPNL